MLRIAALLEVTVRCAFTAFLAVPLLFSSTTLSAQDGIPLEVGSRIRITAPDMGIEQRPATVEAVRGNTLVVLADSTLNVPLASVARLDVYRGRKSFGVVKGAGYGALIGAGTGLVSGLIYGASNEAECPVIDESPEGPCPLLYGAVLGLAGGMTGALVGFVAGALIKTDRWEEVTPARFSLTPAVTYDGRVGFRASVRF